MERRTSYSRLVYVPTSAARVANVKNNRETLLLAKASRGISCESDGTSRTFYRERARTSNFLKRVNSKSTGQLRAKDNGVDQKTSDITRSEAREAIKPQRVRRISLDINRTEETQRRIQEFLSRDVPSDQSTRNKQIGELNGLGSLKKVERDFERSLNEISPGKKQTQGPSQKPFRVRSRASGVCFSCSHCHLQRLPSASLPNIATGRGAEVYPCKPTKTPFRKLSVPAMGSQMSLDRNRPYVVNTSCLFSTGSDITSKDVYKTKGNRTNERLDSASTKKHRV